MLTEMNSSSDGIGHALVIGGSMAGLFAARVLSERFGRVTIVERDSFPEGPQFRKGVPQSRHLHAFMMRGRMISDRLFPGLSEELEELVLIGPIESERRAHATLRKTPTTRPSTRTSRLRIGSIAAFSGWSRM